MTTPSTSMIPTRDYPERWQKVQTMMRQQNLDVLIAYTAK